MNFLAQYIKCSSNAHAAEQKQLQNIAKLVSVTSLFIKNISPSLKLNDLIFHSGLRDFLKELLRNNFIIYWI